MALTPSSSDMSVICRCCLQEKDDLISLLKVVSETIPVNYAALVKKCVGVEVIVSDGLPSQICSGCSNEAERFYKFKDMCLSSEQKLRPTATLGLEFIEVACQTDECQNEENEENSKDAGKEDNSKGVLQGSCEDLNISLSVEIKDVGAAETQSSNRTLGNPPDLALSEESILSVLGMQKSKVSDVLEENELPSLSSPVSDGDFSTWLAENQEEIKGSGEDAEQDSSLCDGNKGQKDANSISSDKNTLGNQNESKEKEAEEQVLEKDSPEEESGKSETDQNVEMGEKIGDQGAKSVVESVNYNLGPSIGGRVTVKSLEDLTYDPKLIPQTVKPSGSSNSALEECEVPEAERGSEVFVSKCGFVDNSEMIPSSSTSCDSRLHIASEPQNIVDDSTIRTEDQSVDSFAKENNDSPTLDEPASDDQKNVEEDKCSTEKPLGDSLAPSDTGDSGIENTSENSRKRPREEVSCDRDVTEGTCSPFVKKSHTGEEAVDSKTTTEDVEMKDGDNEITSSEQTSSIEDRIGEEANANNDKPAGINEMNTSNSGVEDVQNDASQPDNSSDYDIADDGCAYDSSGSEYVPVDSPALSDEADDSSRPHRPRTRPKTRGKHNTNKLRVQGFGIRECRVVLSDIARPGSSALTNSNSMSSHVSVSSLKSIENGEDNVKNAGKEDGEKEADGMSENTSSCTAWIKVEPEDMEEMEGEADEENNMGSGEVDSGTVEQGMASSTDANAETSQGASAENQTVLTRVVGGRRRFLCPFCAKAFHTRNQMILHRGVHTGDLPFGCEVCGKRFALRCRLLRHMSVHDASIVCEFCGMDFKTNIMLGRHIKAKHTIPSYTYPPLSNIAASNLKSSIKKPAPVPAPHSKGVQRFPCRLCPRVFSSINGLKGHKRAHKNHQVKVPDAVSNPVEQKTEQNVCKICGMSFPNPLYLKSHMVCHTIVRPNSGKVNSIEIPGTSSGAEEIPLKASNLKAPEESINMMEPTVLIHESPSAFGDSPYQYNQGGMMMQNVCMVCSQIFPTQEKLLRHQVVANHHKTWNCEECPAMFSNSQQLQNHVLSVHPANSNFVKKEYKCNICGKVFSKSSRLNQHMNYHMTASEPITCQLCGKYFATIEQLNMHKKVHESAPARGVNSDLCCSVCRRVFSKRSRLKRHMILHESQSFPCSKCSKTFISEELLTEHQLHHTQNVPQSPISQPASVSQSPSESEDVSGGLPCTACGRVFTNKGRLKQHVVVHTKSGFVACQNCFKVFANGQMLEMHAAVCSKAEEGSNGSQSNASSKSASIPHPSGFASCTSCGKAFPSKELLTEHEKTCVGLTVVKKLDGTWKVLENADDRPRGSSIGSSSNSSRGMHQNITKDTTGETKTYSCKVCGKSFINYHGLNSHMRFHQENAGTYKCELCSKLFPSRNKLTQHMSSHSAVYRCGICSQAFGLVDELKKHVSQCVAAQKSGNTSNYFHCTGCSEVFSLLEQLAAHIKCHANEFPHACHECYKVFANQGQLNRHMGTHANQSQTRNVCKICNKTFNNYAALEKHIVVHTGEKKFECPYCMQRFSQRSSLHRHKLTQHETKM